MLSTVFWLGNSPGSASTILQLRLHPTIIGFRDEMVGKRRRHEDRHRSNLHHLARQLVPEVMERSGGKSGGIATNIGIHFFDMCVGFWASAGNRLHSMTPMKAAGCLEFANARVRWFLSIDRNDLPTTALEAGKKTFRNITVNHRISNFPTGLSTFIHKAMQES